MHKNLVADVTRFSQECTQYFEANPPEQNSNRKTLTIPGPVEELGMDHLVHLALDRLNQNLPPELRGEFDVVLDREMVCQRNLA